MKAVDLKNIIAYQEAAVVSKEILKTDGGTVTLFAFDAEQGLSEHTAPFDVLVNVVEGVAAVMISGTAHELSEGQMIIMPAGKPHSLQAKKRFKMLLVMLKK